MELRRMGTRKHSQKQQRTNGYKTQVFLGGSSVVRQVVNGSEKSGVRTTHVLGGGWEGNRITGADLFF